MQGHLQIVGRLMALEGPQAFGVKNPCFVRIGLLVELDLGDARVREQQRAAALDASVELAHAATIFPSMESGVNACTRQGPGCIC